MPSSIVRILVLGAALGAPFAAFCGPVNVNSADAAQIAKELKGVGLSKAQDIVRYRDKNGPFKSPEDLRKVKGFGAKTLERNRANIRVGGDKPGKSHDAQPAAEQ